MATVLLHRKHLRPPSYVRLDANPHHRQPRETLTKIGVLHLPHSKGIAHPSSFIQVPLVKIGSEGISEAECTEYEKQLGYIPDIRACYPSTFSWNRRKLLDVSDLPHEAIPKGAVCKMYVCVDERSDLPHNIAQESNVGLCGVFGDAFMFKMESEPTGSGGAHYLHKDENFAQSGSGSVVWRRALQKLYFDMRKEGRLEAEGMTSETYDSARIEQSLKMMGQGMW